MIKPKNAPRLISHAIEQNIRLKARIYLESDRKEIEKLQNKIASNNIMIQKWRCS